MHGPAASTSVGKRGLSDLHQASKRTGHAAIAGEQPSASKNRVLVRRRRRSLTGRSANAVVVRPGWPDRRMTRSENGFVIWSAGDPPAPQPSQRRRRKTRSSCGRSRSASAVRRGWRVRPRTKGGAGRAGRHRVSATPCRAVEADVHEMAGRWIRDADLAAKGTLHALSRLPFALWSSLVRSGRAFEDDFYEPPPRRRVRF